MKKTYNINLNGQVFCIDDDACLKLQSYIDTLESHYLKEEDGREIMADIESRIAELLKEVLGKGYKQVVTMEDIDQIIRIMCSPDVIIDEDTDKSTEPIKRKLYRDTDESVLGGVASGIAAYFDISVVWIRIAFVLLAFFYGVTILAYIILWIATPAAWQPIQNPKPNKFGDGKMACINFPTVVAALTLYNNVPENRKESTDKRPDYQTKAQYLAKGKEIYEWGVENLLDKVTGKIADSRHGNGNPAWKAHVYNQATFIGASILLYKATGEKRYLDNAILAADYTVKDMSAEHKVLPFESGIEQGIYTAIFAEYMARLVYDCGQTQYLPFLKHTIKTGWANRDETRNVCGGEYHKKLPAGAEIDSYSASGIPALMLLFPAKK